MVVGVRIDFYLAKQTVLLYSLCIECDTTIQYQNINRFKFGITNRWDINANFIKSTNIVRSFIWSNYEIKAAELLTRLIKSSKYFYLIQTKYTFNYTHSLAVLVFCLFIYRSAHKVLAFREDEKDSIYIIFTVFLPDNMLW